MSHKGLEYLARIAASCKPNAKILEAGSLYGCSAWVLSKNASAGSSVYAIDPWEHHGFLVRFQKNNLRVPELSIHAFKAYTHDCENLTAVQGYSPAAASDLDIENLDIVFEDAAHSYDILKENVEYFFPKLNPGGVICGDDYQSSFPGVIKCVDELAESLGIKPEVCGQVWSLRKPLDDGKAVNVYSKVNDHYQGEIGVKIVDTNDQEIVASPHCFTSNLFRPTRPESVSIFWHNNNFSDLDFIWQLEFDDDTQTAELASGNTVECEGKKIVGLRVELVGKDKQNYSVGYQIATFENLDDDLKTLGPSQERYNGTWLHSKDKNKGVYGFSISLADKDLIQMRKQHSLLIKSGKNVGESIYGNSAKKNKQK